MIFTLIPRNTATNNEASYDLSVNNDMTEIFTYGVSKAMMGGTLSKLTFHSVTDVEDPINDKAEQRRDVLLLSIPTPALLEMCVNILSTAQVSVDAMSNSGKKADNKIKNILKNINIDNNPA